MDVFYGTDYKKSWKFILFKEKGFRKAIYSLEDGNFRNKFDQDIRGFFGNVGIGVISDYKA